MGDLTKFTKSVNYTMVESLVRRIPSGSTLAHRLQHPCLPVGLAVCEADMIDIVDRINEIADRIASKNMLIHASQVRESAVEISRQRHEIERLQKENHQLRVTLADKVRTNIELWTALQRIDGINDNPACFNVDIDAILNAVLKLKP